MLEKDKKKFEIFPWNKNFETEIVEIDEQHKTIVALLNKLANDLTKDELIEVEHTFEELAKYAEFHFECEEKVWVKYIKDNSIINAHKDSHASFLPSVKELREKNKSENLHEVIEEVILFLIKWLAFHIIDEDKRLALVIKSLEDGKDVNEAIYTADELMSGTLKNLIDTVLTMYDEISIKAINLIRERTRRIKAEKELLEINKKLTKLSITDQLTKLYNRRYYDDILKRELRKAKRNKTNIALILLDIDYFKNINDTYGHAYGDKVLVLVAACLEKICKRPNDFVFRVGGEEFAILITNEKNENIFSFTKILQKSIQDLKIENKNSKISNYLTLSAGVVCKIPISKDTSDSIMKSADDRLYLAKKDGRNKIIFN